MRFESPNVDKVFDCLLCERLLEEASATWVTFRATVDFLSEDTANLLPQFSGNSL